MGEVKINTSEIFILRVSWNISAKILGGDIIPLVYSLMLIIFWHAIRPNGVYDPQYILSWVIWCKNDNITSWSFGNKTGWAQILSLFLDISVLLDDVSLGYTCLGKYSFIRYNMSYKPGCICICSLMISHISFLAQW